MNLRLAPLLAVLGVVVLPLAARARPQPRSIHRQIIRFPDDAGVVNVRLPPYNAQGDGITDDTRALQQAVWDHPGSRPIIYLPRGVYLVSRPITQKMDPAVAESLGLDPKNYQQNKWNASTIFVGEEQHRTIIRLKDHVIPVHGEQLARRDDEKFDVDAYATGVLRFGSSYAHDQQTGSGDSAFDNSIANLTVDVGRGNDCCGIVWAANNRGAIRDVTVRDPDPDPQRGIWGVNMTLPSVGPCLVRNLTVRGFEFAVADASSYTNTFEDLVCQDQKVGGIVYVGPGVSAVRHLRSVNRVPAIVAIEAARSHQVVLVDSNLSGGAPDQPPFVGVGGPAQGGATWFHAKGVTISGYSSQDAGQFNSETLPQSDGQPSTTLGLPTVETPSFWTNDFTRWANVRRFREPGDEDDTASIQRAVDSGKPVVYLPRGVYTISDTIHVRGRIKQIYGCDSTIVPSETGNHGYFADAHDAHPAFRFEGADYARGPVFVEEFDVYDNTLGGHPARGCVMFEDASLRPVVFKNLLVINGGPFYRNVLPSGPVHFENVSSSAHQPNRLTFRGQAVFARQLNVESRPYLVPGDWSAQVVLTDGATLWALGTKFEDYSFVMSLAGGSRAELLGASLTWTDPDPDPDAQPGPPPFFLVDHSQLSVAFQDFNRSSKGPEKIRFVLTEITGAGSEEKTFHVLGPPGATGRTDGPVTTVPSFGSDHDGLTNWQRGFSLYSTPH